MRSLSTPFMITSSYPFLSWDHQLPFSRWYFDLWDHQLPLSLRASTTIFFMRPSAIPFIHEIINYPFSLMRSPTTLSPLVLSLMRSANFHLDQLPFFLTRSSAIPFYSWDHQLPLFPQELINCPIPVGTFTYEIINYPFSLKSSSTALSPLVLSLMRPSATSFSLEIISYRFFFSHEIISYPIYSWDDQSTPFL